MFLMKQLPSTSEFGDFTKNQEAAILKLDFEGMRYLADMGGPDVLDQAIKKSPEKFSAEELAQLYEQAHKSMARFNEEVAKGLPEGSQDKASFLRRAHESSILSKFYYEKAHPQPKATTAE
jgi:hypothetical protein